MSTDENRNERMAEVILGDGQTVRATLLHIHRRAWDDTVVEKAVTNLSERDLFALMVVTSPMISDGDEVDVWLRGLCVREQDRRDDLNEQRAAA